MKLKSFLFVITLLFSVLLNAQSIPEKEICGAAIEALMGRGSISKYVDNYLEGNHKVYVFASRRKSSDKDACYISGNQIIWRVEAASGIYKGRWRTSQYDEKVFFKIEGDVLTIVVTFNGNDGTTTKYSIKKLTSSIK